MKKGDIVTIYDRSYSRVIKDGRMLDGMDCLPRDGDTQFVVIETDCRFPKTSQWVGSDYNNTVIQSLNTGEVVFIEERFLRPAKHIIVLDGKPIEISHESFLSLKKQLA